MARYFKLNVVICILARALFVVFLMGDRLASFAQGETFSGYVTYVVEDSIYLEIVGEHHLKAGDTGDILLRGREAAYVRVMESSSRYIFVQIISQDSGVTLSSGDSIVFQIRMKATAE